MRRVVVVASVLLAGSGTQAGSGAGPAVPVVVERVHPVAREGFGPRDPALLLVYVVDSDGEPVEGAIVTLAGTARRTVPMTTAKDGTVLMRLDAGGRLTVRASAAGEGSAEARTVIVRNGGLTAVALPLADDDED
jgi:Carboxypeptidase regulatory-like domain